MYGCIFTYTGAKIKKGWFSIIYKNAHPVPIKPINLFVFYLFICILCFEANGNWFQGCDKPSLRGAMSHRYFPDCYGRGAVGYTTGVTRKPRNQSQTDLSTP